MKVVTYSRQDMQYARKAGFKGKKPKKGKRNPVAYVDACNVFAEKVKAKAAEGRKKEQQMKEAKAAMEKIRKNGQ